MKQQFSIKIIQAFIFINIAFLTTPHAFAENSGTVSITNSLVPENPIIVTATRSPSPANDVLADYSYISSEEIAQAGQTSLPDLLQQQRGVQISSSGGSGNISSIYLRGTSNAQSLVLIDGVKVDSMGGGAIWNAIPLSLIDHIEIIYGPQSTFYGSDAMGGVIQIFTKKGGGPTQFEASTGYGSYNTSISSASVSGSIGKEGSTNYSLGVSQENSAGFNTVASNNPANPNGTNYRGYGAFPTNIATGYTRLGASGSLSNTWETGQEIGLKVFASKNNWQYPTADQSDPNYFNNYNYATTPMIDSAVNQLALFSAYTKNQITESWKSLFQVSSSNNSSQNNTLFSNDVLNTPSYDFLWQNDIKIGQDNLQLLAERRMQYAYMNNSPYQTAGCTECTVSQLRTTNSIAAAYELHRGNNLATIALRNDDISSYGSKTTGSVAYGYFWTERLRTNINYGTGFRAPSFNDLYYPGYGTTTLQPETNRNLEGGIHYEAPQYAVHLTAYENDIKNFILPINCDPTDYICQANYPSGSRPLNFSSVQIKGASLGVDGKIENLTLKASGDAMSTVDQTTGLAVPNRANWVGNFLADYKLKKFNFGTNITLSGQRWGAVTYNSSGNYNYEYMPSYAIVNLYASYQIDKQLTLFTRWNNVFDSQYQTSYGYANAGSNVFVGLRYSMQ